eukprot:4877765-Pleurochrysis_carterae.AAC.2
MAAGDAESLANADPRYKLEHSVAMEAQARLHVTKAAPESPRAAEASADATREGVGPAGPTPASDREGLAISPPLISDRIFSIARYAKEARRAALAPLITLVSAALECVPLPLASSNYFYIKSNVIAVQNTDRQPHASSPSPTTRSKLYNVLYILKIEILTHGAVI